MLTITADNLFNRFRGPVADLCFGLDRSSLRTTDGQLSWSQWPNKVWEETAALYVANKTWAIKQGEYGETNFRYHTRSSHGLIAMGLRCKRHAEHRTEDSWRLRHRFRKVFTCVRSREVVCGACFNDRLASTLFDLRGNFVRVSFWASGSSI